MLGTSGKDETGTLAAVVDVERAIQHLQQNVYFYGSYGCAVLPTSHCLTEGPQALALDECHLILVCLDSWEYHVKRYLGPSILQCGALGVMPHKNGSRPTCSARECLGNPFLTLR